MTAALAQNPTPTPPPSAIPSSRRKERGSRRLPVRLGRYMLFERIGYGGMANIYLARYRTELGAKRLCVIKEVLPELAHDPRIADLLVEEARFSARLNHANVVKVEDLCRADGNLYIAMEYVEGFDLRELLRRAAVGRVPFPIAYSLLIVRDILRGLDYAHRLRDEMGKPLGIVHRDVSPANVLVSFEGEVKLCDFGIARSGETTPESFQGKAGYTSPEQARGETLDGRADVFAVGIMLWELCAGRRLYKAKLGQTLLEAAQNADIPELPSRGFPEEQELFGIVRRALSKDQDHRYPTAAAMLRDLERYATNARMMASPLQFGEWMREHFGKEILSERRSRERAIEAIERGPALVMTPIAKPKKKSEKSAKQEGEALTPTPPTQKVITRPEALDERTQNTPKPPSSGVRKAKVANPAERARKLVKKRRQVLEDKASQGALMKTSKQEANDGRYAGAILLAAAAMVAILVMLSFTSGG